MNQALSVDCGDAVEPLEGNYFVAVYPTFSCWKQESLPAVQHALLRTPPARQRAPLGLYIHVPFCLKRCEFCYYRSYAGQSRTMRERYVDALLRELLLYRSYPAVADRPLEFVYVGGGTPSLLSVEQIERLFQGLGKIFSLREVREITFECAPKSVTRRRLATLAELGVTRISLGVQQLDDDVLRRNGRIHLTRDAEKAYAAIVRCGFPTVNVDLMAGLVGETDETFHASLGRVLQWRPASVTMYPVEVPANTPLSRALHENRVPPPADWNEKRRRLREAWDRLIAAGYTVRSCYAAVRNPDADRFLYQEEQYRGADLIGVGASSFSYFGGVHYQNATSLEDYLASLHHDRLPLARAYALDEEEQMVRELILQLKLGQVEEPYFRRKFGVDIGERFARPLAEMASRGWIRDDSGSWKLSAEGRARIDRLLPEFYLPQHRLLSYW